MDDQRRFLRIIDEVGSALTPEQRERLLSVPLDGNGMPHWSLPKGPDWAQKFIHPAPWHRLFCGEERPCPLPIGQRPRVHVHWKRGNERRIWFPAEQVSQNSVDNLRTDEELFVLWEQERGVA